MNQSQPEDGLALQIEEQVVDLRGTPWEAWVALAIFWALGLTVFYQFVTRYVLNDSAAWTEEIARYLLIGVVFVGAAIGVTRNNHIQVDFFYRLMPPRLGRAMATMVDGVRIVFFGAMIVLSVQLVARSGTYKMTVVDLPMSIVYAVCCAGFAAMFTRAIQVAMVHWRRGYSVLERPESTLADR